MAVRQSFSASDAAHAEYLAYLPLRRGPGEIRLLSSPFPGQFPCRDVSRASGVCLPRMPMASISSRKGPGPRCSHLPEPCPAPPGETLLPRIWARPPVGLSGWILSRLWSERAYLEKKLQKSALHFSLPHVKGPAWANNF